MRRRAQDEKVDNRDITHTAISSVSDNCKRKKERGS